jgi:hypothetical protein
MYYIYYRMNKLHKKLREHLQKRMNAALLAVSVAFSHIDKEKHLFTIKKMNVRRRVLPTRLVQFDDDCELRTSATVTKTKTKNHRK